MCIFIKIIHRGVIVISTGVDCNKFSLKKLEYSNSKPINLLFVGRLIQRKNIDKIIYAFEEIRNLIDCNLTIVGDGPDRKRLEKISKDVIFTGVVNNTEKYYKEADIFISPSQYGEGLQGTILEAMSSGLTVIATNTKINRKLLSDERGILIDTDTKSIVNGIKKAINSNRVKIANNCRKYVLDKYDWQNKVKEIIEVLK
ncbi:MAG: glycosyltransferase family 4 protein [Clostridia bacterium]|nr:glycosyltransferase family 4 protein [Clostridia bacterium]